MFSSLNLDLQVKSQLDTVKRHQHVLSLTSMVKEKLPVVNVSLFVLVATALQKIEVAQDTSIELLSILNPINNIKTNCILKILFIHAFYFLAKFITNICFRAK